MRTSYATSDSLAGYLSLLWMSSSTEQSNFSMRADISRCTEITLVVHFSHIKLVNFLQTGWQDMGGDIAVESVLNWGGKLVKRHYQRW
jgi:hypothetical protein